MRIHTEDSSERLIPRNCGGAFFLTLTNARRLDEDLYDTAPFINEVRALPVLAGQNQDTKPANLHTQVVHSLFEKSSLVKITPTLSWEL
jgi:hypothetical protein